MITFPDLNFIHCSFSIAHTSDIQESLMSDERSIRSVESQENAEQQTQLLMERTDQDGNSRIVAGEGKAENQHGSMFGKSLREAPINLSNFSGLFFFISSLP